MFPISLFDNLLSLFWLMYLIIFWRRKKLHSCELYTSPSMFWYLYFYTIENHPGCCTSPYLLCGAVRGRCVTPEMNAANGPTCTPLGHHLGSPLRELQEILFGRDYLPLPTTGHNSCPKVLHASPGSPLLAPYLLEGWSSKVFFTHPDISVLVFYYTIIHFSFELYYEIPAWEINVLPPRATQADHRGVGEQGGKREDANSNVMSSLSSPWHAHITVSATEFLPIKPPTERQVEVMAEEIRSLSPLERPN